MATTRAQNRVRRPAPPSARARRHLVAAALMVIVGAFLPWVATGVGNVIGVRGGGLWTMYAGFLGLAGAALRWHRVAAGHAAVLAAAAVVIPVWQVVHVLSLVGTAGWLPGPGLVLTFGGGVLAGVAALTLLRVSRERATAGEPA